MREETSQEENRYHYINSMSAASILKREWLKAEGKTTTFKPLGTVDVSPIFIGVLQAIYAKTVTRTHRAAAGVDIMLQHFACDLRPDTHRDNKLNVSISVLHRLLRCKYSGRPKR